MSPNFPSALLSLALQLGVLSAPIAQAQGDVNSLLSRGIDAHMQSRFSEAETSYASALAAAKLLGAGTWEYGRALTLLALSCHINGQRKEAVQFYQASIDFHRRYFPNSGDLALPVEGLGTLYLEQKRFKSAKPLLEEAVHLEEAEDKRTQVPDHYGLASALASLADVYEGLSKPNKAETFYKGAVGLFGGPQSFVFNLLSSEILNPHPIILLKAGDYYRHHGQEETAKGYYTRAMQAWENWLGGKFEGRPSMKARLLDYKGRNYIALGYIPEAKEHLTQALALYKSLYGDADPRTAEAARLRGALK